MPDRRRELSWPQGTGCEDHHHAGDLSRRRYAIRSVHSSWQTGDGEYRSRYSVHRVTAQELAQAVNDRGYHLSTRQILRQSFCSEVFVRPVVKEEL
jgi:hypothetical protein